MFNWISGTTIVCNEIFFSKVIEIFPYRGDRAEKIEFIQNVQLWTDFLASILFIVGGRILNLILTLNYRHFEIESNMGSHPTEAKIDGIKGIKGFS